MSNRCSGAVQAERTTLWVRGDAYFVDPEGKGQRGALEGCRGTELPGLIYFLEACGADLDVSVNARSGVSYDGRYAVQVHSLGDLQGIDSNVAIDSTLYVAPETGLPIATKSVLTDDYGGTTLHHGSETTYEYEYVERSSLPADFFAPEGIGFKDPGVR